MLQWALVEFGTIDEISWNFPSDVKDTFEFYNAIEDQGDRSILYGNLESYHKMPVLFRIILQAPASTEVRMVLEIGTRC
ncbi:BBT_HP_G0133300.mRNA.1.CDS.1 [Saccharomyces cerevisiae]|nr:BBT_HP_G0133300.mRNA.1.CDS.1 [Saccharomyces cerevisiae]CAI6976971.1 BBT_HP_G0133300.mRNA.1.CDS.1 [Saccharomyces cerevisiae]